MGRLTYDAEIEAERSGGRSRDYRAMFLARNVAETPDFGVDYHGNRIEGWGADSGVYLKVACDSGSSCPAVLLVLSVASAEAIVKIVGAALAEHRERLARQREKAERARERRKARKKG